MFCPNANANVATTSDLLLQAPSMALEKGLNNLLIRSYLYKTSKMKRLYSKSVNTTVSFHCEFYLRALMWLWMLFRYLGIGDTLKFSLVGCIYVARVYTLFLPFHPEYSLIHIALNIPEVLGPRMSSIRRIGSCKRFVLLRTIWNSLKL